MCKLENTWTVPPPLCHILFVQSCHKVLLTMSVTGGESPFSHSRLVQTNRSNCLSMVYSGQELAYIVVFRDQNGTHSLALPQWAFLPTTINASLGGGVYGLATIHHSHSHNNDDAVTQERDDLDRRPEIITDLDRRPAITTGSFLLWLCKYLSWYQYSWVHALTCTHTLI